ncbi:MAG TPA: hypothetical protein VM096_08390 [Vicinamibacterales bacterium]|nr:hypothetical protein [Vicinamibacterales bacterium]
MSIRLITTISAMTIAAAFTVNAQTPSTTSQTQPQSRPQTQSPTDRQRTGGDTQDRAQQSVTVTGCLQAGNGAAGSGSGMTGSSTSGSSTSGSSTSGSSASGSSASGSGTRGSGSGASGGGMGEGYVLSNVKMSQGASTSAMGLASMYQIKGGSVKDSDLKNHIGHQVEITGRLDNSNNGTHAGMSGTSGAGTTGTSGTSGSGTTGTSGTSGSGTSGTSGTSGSGTSGTTGTSGSGTSGTGGTSGTRMGAGASTGSMGNNSNMPTLAAMSVKMVSSSCQAQ